MMSSREKSKIENNITFSSIFSKESLNLSLLKLIYFGRELVVNRRHMHIAQVLQFVVASLRVIRLVHKVQLLGQRALEFFQHPAEVERRKYPADHVEQNSTRKNIALESVLQIQVLQLDRNLFAFFGLRPVHLGKAGGRNRSVVELGENFVRQLIELFFKQKINLN